MQDVQKNEQWAGNPGAGALQENTKKMERMAQGCRGTRERGAEGSSRYNLGRQGFVMDTGQGAV